MYPTKHTLNDFIGSYSLKNLEHSVETIVPPSHDSDSTFKRRLMNSVEVNSESTIRIFFFLSALIALSLFNVSQFFMVDVLKSYWKYNYLFFVCQQHQLCHSLLNSENLQNLPVSMKETKYKVKIHAQVEDTGYSKHNGVENYFYFFRLFFISRLFNSFPSPSQKRKKKIVIIIST